MNIKRFSHHRFLLATLAVVAVALYLIPVKLKISGTLHAFTNAIAEALIVAVVVSVALLRQADG